MEVRLLKRLKKLAECRICCELNYDIKHGYYPTFWENNAWGDTERYIDFGFRYFDRFYDRQKAMKFMNDIIDVYRRKFILDEVRRMKAQKLTKEFHNK